MIEISSETISILYADGTSAVFDPEELRARLEKSFLASGTGDIWVAGELVLAVEYALQCRNDGENSTVIRASEIEDCVERILEDAGYAAVARQFSKSTVSSGDFGKLTPDGIESYLTQKLQLSPDDAQTLAQYVVQAMTNIGALRCPPHLVLELARFFRDKIAISGSLSIPKIQPHNTTQTHADKDKIPPHVWRIHFNDTVFPSVRAEIDLPGLFQDCGMMPPLTEFSLEPVLLSVAEAIDEQYQIIKETHPDDIPLILTLHGFQEFSARWLCFESNTDKKIQEKRVRAFTTFLRTLFNVKPFKIFVC